MSELEKEVEKSLEIINSVESTVVDPLADFEKNVKRMAEITGEINKTLDKVHEEVDTGRFKVGQILPFVRIHFTFEFTDGGVPTGETSHVITSANSFNPARDKLIKLEIVPLKVLEHHKVRWTYDDNSVEPKYDGYILINEKDQVKYNNQYPHADYGQTTDTANWIASVKSEHILKTDSDGNFLKDEKDHYIRIEGVNPDLEDDLLHAGLIYDRLDIDEDRLRALPENIRKPIEDFKTLFTKALDDAGFEIQWETLGTSNFKISRVVQKGDKSKW